MSPQLFGGAREVTVGPAAWEGCLNTLDFFLHVPVPVARRFKASAADWAPLPPKDFGVAVEATAVLVGAELDLAGGNAYADQARKRVRISLHGEGCLKLWSLTRELQMDA